MIANRGRDYETWQKDYKSGQGLQIGAEHNETLFYTIDQFHNL